MVKKYFKRWEENKGNFRRNFVLAVIAFFLLSGQFGEPETQATAERCLSHNTYVVTPIQGFYITSESSYSVCESECTVQYNENPEGWGVLSGFLNIFDWIASWIGVNTDFATCVVIGEDNKYVLADGEGEASLKCKSGDATLVKERWEPWIKNVYQCTPSSAGGGCRSWQRPFAKILNGIWKNNKMDCATSAYLVMGAGVMIALAVI